MWETRGRQHMIPFTSIAFTEFIVFSKESISIVTGDLFARFNVPQNLYTGSISACWHKLQQTPHISKILFPVYRLIYKLVFIFESRHKRRTSAKLNFSVYRLIFKSVNRLIFIFSPASYVLTLQFGRQSVKTIKKTP